MNGYRPCNYGCGAVKYDLDRGEEEQARIGQVQHCRLCGALTVMPMPPAEAHAGLAKDAGPSDSEP